MPINHNDELYRKIGNMIKARRVAIDLSQQEIADYVDVTKSAVSRWESGEVENIGRLKIQKLSEILRISPVSIVLGEDIDNAIPYQTKKVPMLGITAAGEPLMVADQPCEYYVEIDKDIDVDYCLKVKGDSMIDARIHDGDMVFFRQQPEVENGEIAVVSIDNEVTLKRFYKSDQGVILKPENSRYQPMFYTEKDFRDVRILGKAVFFQGKIY